MMTSIVSMGVQPRFSMVSRIAWVTPMKPRTKFRNTAARMISMIMALERMVPSKAAFSISTLSARFIAAMTKAKTTPMEAASVGVAMPA